MNIFSKLCGCFLVLALLLAGCSTGGKFDPETTTDYAEIGFHPNHWELTNAEGQKLYFPRVRAKQYKPCDEVFELGGDMEHYKDHLSPGLSLITYFITPFSDFFTVQTRPSMELPAVFSVDFYKDGKCVSSSSVSGTFEGTATLYADGVIELLGNNSNFKARFSPQEEFDYSSIFVEGSGERHVKLQLVDGELVAEGMVGKYTVIKSDSEGKNISVETYQGKEPAS